MQWNLVPWKVGKRYKGSLQVNYKLRCPCTRHEAYKRSGGSDPLILNLGIIWRWVVRFTPRPFYIRWLWEWVGPTAGLDFWPNFFFLFFVFSFFLLLLLLFLFFFFFFFFFIILHGTTFQCGPSPPYWTSLRQLCFLSLFPTRNFASINICLYTAPPSVFGRSLSPLPWWLLLNTWFIFFHCPFC